MCVFFFVIARALYLDGGRREGLLYSAAAAAAGPTVKMRRETSRNGQCGLGIEASRGAAIKQGSPVLRSRRSAEKKRVHAAQPKKERNRLNILMGSGPLLSLASGRQWHWAASSPARGLAGLQTPDQHRAGEMRGREGLGLVVATCVPIYLLLGMHVLSAVSCRAPASSAALFSW